MTPKPQDLVRRRLLDPRPGHFHICDLINRVKDGLYAKDYISDYVLGMILWALFCDIIREKDDAMVFQLAFVHPGFTHREFRKGYNNYGRPFLGPDGLILTLEGRLLCGDGTSGIGVSPLDRPEDIKTHPNYESWLKASLYAGLEPGDILYKRIHPTLNTKKKCDAHINARFDEHGYEPGPLSRPFNNNL
jgi:hypothetical protein